MPSIDLSDFLSIIDICITLLIGYFLSHWMSVRDSRTRALKDFYIEQLIKIKNETDSFFNDVFAGKLNSREISDWYGKHQNECFCFDEGLRMALPINKKNINDVVNDIHETITGSDYFNDHFKDDKYQLNNKEYLEILSLRQKVNTSFNEYLVQINNCRQFTYFEILWQRIKLNYKYCTENKKGWLKILLLPFFKLLKVVIILILIYGIVLLCQNKLIPKSKIGNAPQNTMLQSKDTLVVSCLFEKKE